MITNLVEKYLAETNSTLADWEGECIPLLWRVKRFLDKRNVRSSVFTITAENKFEKLFPSTQRGKVWVYHVVIVAKKQVHDPWFGKPLPVQKYLRKMFPGQKVKLFRNE